MKYKLQTLLGLVAIVVVTMVIRYGSTASKTHEVLPASVTGRTQTKGQLGGKPSAALENGTVAATSESAAPVQVKRLQAMDAPQTQVMTTALATIPEGDFKQALMQLTPESRERALRKVVKLKLGPKDFSTLRVAATGQLYYVCDLAPPSGAASAQAFNAANSQESTAPLTGAAPVPISSPPVRHSRPGASNVLYLDFNGHTITGTSWNTGGGATTYVAKPFDKDGDLATFSDAEQAIIIQVWERVAEDYSPFDVDVTTEEPAQFTSTTGRAVITSDIDENELDMPSKGSGGVAYLDVFGASDYVTSSSPAFVYLSDNAGNIAEAVSHELGHNMGLSHDGTVAHDAVLKANYYNGHGTGETSWGPIMGTGYGRNVTQWSKGEYLYADRTSQDDFAVIAGKLAYRTDDAGDSTTAPAVAPISGAVLSGSGVIASMADIDVYAFNASAGMVSITASPYRAASNTYGGNADLKLELLDASGAVVAADDPAATTGASISYNAAAGKYFVRLSASGTGDPMASPPSGYTSYGSAGQYTLTGSLGAASPLIVSAASISIGAGQLFSFAVLGTNSPTSYAATGLPPGLAIDTVTGVISGRPTSTGVFPVSLTATNGLGAGNGTLTISVTDAAPVILAQTAGRQVVARGGGVVTLGLGAQCEWGANVSMAP